MHASSRSISRITGIRGSRTGPPYAIRRLPRQFGIPGYYVRVAPPQAIADRGAFDRVLSIRNQAMDPGLSAAAQFGVDFLQLVRFGLRSLDDPLIVGSVRLADALLKIGHPQRPVLASIFRRRLRGARRRQRLRWSRPRALMAVAHRRTRALRDRLRQRSHAPHGSDGAHGLVRRDAPRTGVGRRPDPGTWFASGPGDRICDAARLDARGIFEARGLARLEAPLRPARVRVATLRRKAQHAGARHLVRARGNHRHGARHVVGARFARAGESCATASTGGASGGCTDPAQ